MSSLASQSPTLSAYHFDSADIAFALAWEVYAPGLTGWTVLVETDEDGSDLILVDPPLAFDRGFTIRRRGDHTTVTWDGGSRQVDSLRQALLLICPLAPDAMQAAEALAAEPALT